ncbi:hypothetical protein, partial [Kutzneria kofuensis]|uniref:hypothetical protein n=1 Tax=Kutzneria kofuensis TaxID=103725 RepID=UPI0031EDE35D
MGEPVGVLVAVQQVGQVVPEHCGAAGFQHDDRGAVPKLRLQRLQRATGDPLGGGELAGGDPGESTADSPIRSDHLEAAASNTCTAASPMAGWKLCGEGVRPQQHLAAVPGGAGPAGQPLHEALPCEQRNLTLPGDAAEGLDQPQVETELTRLGAKAARRAHSGSQPIE